MEQRSSCGGAWRLLCDIILQNCLLVSACTIKPNVMFVIRHVRQGLAMLFVLPEYQREMLNRIRLHQTTNIGSCPVK